MVVASSDIVRDLHVVDHGLENFVHFSRRGEQTGILQPFEALSSACSPTCWRQRLRCIGGFIALVLHRLG